MTVEERAAIAWQVSGVTYLDYVAWVMESKSKESLRNIVNAADKEGFTFGQLAIIYEAAAIRCGRIELHETDKEV